jgi:hypothetical protein
MVSALQSLSNAPRLYFLPLHLARALTVASQREYKSPSTFAAEAGTHAPGGLPGGGAGAGRGRSGGGERRSAGAALAGGDAGRSLLGM